jgi:farnesyl-diphosphate farnesyltransferase
MLREVTRPAHGSDEGYVRTILVHVSRTFALTIPELPSGLREAATTAYLLCRIADTIEDEPSLSAAEKVRYLTRFSRSVAVAGVEADEDLEDARALAAELAPRCSEQTSEYERDLVANMDRVIRVCRSLDRRSQKAIGRCVEIMCVGMHHYQRSASPSGLPRLQDLDSYCYHVAGVVGEMLTDLFCAYSPEIDARAAALKRLAPSFGQGLQMTNILKDLWDDRRRGACWLPQEVFARRGFDLTRLRSEGEQSFCESLWELIGIAHGHLRHALAFTLLIPPSETGIRRFCGWAIGLALLTLRSIKDNPLFTAGSQVKISRRQVKLVTLCTNLAVRSDRMLERLFEYAARDLPLIIQPSARGGAELHPPIRQQWERESASILHSASS